MYKGINCERKSQLSEILTEPINPRAGDVRYFLTDFFPSAHFPMVFSQGYFPNCAISKAATFQVCPSRSARPLSRSNFSARPLSRYNFSARSTL